jgi:unsaturated rhamnogalacturonyl hydrolase
MKTAAKIIILSLFLGIACQSVNKTEDTQTNNTEWAIKMADTVIENHSQLVYYNRPVGKEKIQYDIAMLGMAIDKLGSIDEKYSLYFQDYIDFFVDTLGNVKKYHPEEYNLDKINFAKDLITLYKRTGDKKYLSAIQLFVKQIENQPKTHSGEFWHKNVYPWQMWLDGTYMALPFIAQYAKEFNRPEWFNLAVFQLIQIYHNTVDETSGLLYHAWDESKTEKWCDPSTGRSREFWGRAVGWYCMALVDVLDYLPENHPQRDEIISILNKVAEAIEKVRDKEQGVWYQILDKAKETGNYPEASCTAMFIYAFAKGSKQEYLPKSYLKIAESSFDSFLKEFVTQRPDGKISLTKICGDCGLGGTPYRDGSYNYYIQVKQVVNDPKGVGPFILASIELKR